MDVETGCTFKLVLDFGGGHALLLEVTLVQVQDKPSLCNIGLQGCDVDRGGDLNGRSELLSSLCVIWLSFKRMVIVGVWGTFRASTISMIRGRP